MRWVRFTIEDNTRFGILEAEHVRAVDGSPFDGYQLGSRRYALTEITIEVPVVPKTFYAVGFNYLGHIKAMGHSSANVPNQPDVGYRAVNALVAHEQAVVIPHDAEQINYEGELVVVIGRQAKHLAPAEALGCVLGYTIGNDVSERTWQAGDRTLWRAKNCDTFKPMGPWIETNVDLDSLETIVRVNGRETSRFPTNEMLFGVATYISTITQYITLYPGDVIWMGTDGVSPALGPGDVVEVEISGIGVLRNAFIASQ